MRLLVILIAVFLVYNVSSLATVYEYSAPDCASNAPACGPIDYPPQNQPKVYVVDDKGVVLDAVVLVERLHATPIYKKYDYEYHYCVKGFCEFDAGLANMVLVEFEFNNGRYNPNLSYKPFSDLEALDGIVLKRWEFPKDTFRTGLLYIFNLTSGDLYIYNYKYDMSKYDIEWQNKYSAKYFPSDEEPISTEKNNLELTDGIEIVEERDIKIFPYYNGRRILDNKVMIETAKGEFHPCVDGYCQLGELHLEGLDLVLLKNPFSTIKSPKESDLPSYARYHQLRQEADVIRAISEEQFTKYNLYKYDFANNRYSYILYDERLQLIEDWNAMDWEAIFPATNPIEPEVNTTLNESNQTDGKDNKENEQEEKEDEEIVFSNPNVIQKVFLFFANLFG